LSERVCTAILAFTVCHERRPPRRGAPTPERPVAEPEAVRGHSMAERCASRAKRRPRKPVPRPVGWHMGDVGLAQADQVVVMVRSERFPAYGCRLNERAMGSGPACA
jgi:hypothetical protein